jgi:streptogramin lyase
VKNLALLLTTTLLFSACATAGGGSPVPSAASPAAQKSKHKVKATIRITIPKRKHHRRIKIHGHYISPATASIEITTTLTGGTPVQANANLSTTDNPGCTTGLVSTTICTVTLSLQPGNYAGTFTTFDGPLSGTGGPTDPATGNKLSAAQTVPFTIAAGAANQINIALDGIPAGVALVPGADSTLSGSTSSGFTAAKCGGSGPSTEKVNVFALDADGNYILGAGAPVPSLSSDSAVVSIAATPGPATPNIFTLSHAISTTAQGPVTLTAAVTPAVDSGGTVKSAQTPLNIAGGAAICGVITMFPQSGTPQLEGIATGPDGNLWYADASGLIGKIDTNGQPIAQVSVGSIPLFITAGGDGNMWFTQSLGSLGSSSTDLSVVGEHPTGQGPEGIAAGTGSDIWFTEYSVAKIAVFAGGMLTEYAPGPKTTNPTSIALGPDGNLWYADITANLGKGLIGRITPSGTATEFTAGVSGQPYSIANQGGKLWYTEYSAGKIGSITTLGAVTQYAIPSSTPANAIAPGPDGNLWFTENTGNVGRITTAGVVTEFSTGVTGGICGLPGITAGPDGSMWFTACDASEIGRIQ